MADFECLICGTPENNNATFFRSEGNYGSTLFDPMDGSHIDVCICNDCLEPLIQRAWAGRERKPVKYGTLFVGWCPTPDRQPVPFMRAMGGYDGEDALQVDLEEIGDTEILPEIDWHEPAVKMVKRELASMGVEDADYISDECLFLKTHDKCGDDGVCRCACHERM